jgi:integrase
LRTIDLSDEACTALRAHQERQTFARRAAGDAWQDYGLVFASRIGTPLEMGRVHKHWNSAVGKAGIPRCRIHDLRHTVASHLMRGGMNVLEVARFLGHSNASLVLEVYGHVAPSTHGKAATLMDALLASQREAAINQ